MQGRPRPDAYVGMRLACMEDAREELRTALSKLGGYRREATAGRDAAGGGWRARDELENAGALGVEARTASSNRAASSKSRSSRQAHNFIAKS